MDVKLLSAPGTNLVSCPQFLVSWPKKTYVDKDTRLSGSWTTKKETILCDSYQN